jgi:pyridoxamine 5'-phosphate oxidase
MDGAPTGTAQHMNWNEATLESLAGGIWEMLGAAAGRPDHPFRFPAIATTNRLDSSLRTVVLRRADPEIRRLVFFTDHRSPKVREIQANEQVQWLFYHPGLGLQVRATSAAMVYRQDAVAREFWEELPLSSRLNYCAGEAPGSPLMEAGDGIPEPLKRNEVDAGALEHGYENFAAVACEVDVFDWLHLSREQNRRASVRWTGAKYSAIWLVP